MTCVSDYMNITWICKICGAVNSVSDGDCGSCSSAYSSGPRESVTNQALLNQGVIFNNAVFAPQPTLDDMLRSAEAYYPDTQLDGAGVNTTIQPQESFGMRVFTWTCNILMWLAIVICGSIFLFFVVIIILAFCSI